MNVHFQVKIINGLNVLSRFIKINAEKAPFLAQKLCIVLLPTILCTKDNYTHG